MKPFYHVAVGVVYNAQGEVLLTQRALDKHQGGKWEFAGGKVEQGEDVKQALVREFDEELGIKPTRMQPLLTIPFEYPEHTVLLDTWEIFDFEGEPYARENQVFRWVNAQDLMQYDFPPANRAIIHAIQLPHYYLITPDEPLSLDEFTQNLERVFRLGVRLCRVRQGKLSNETYQERVEAALAIKGKTKLILDGPPNDKWAEQVAGWHLNSRDLYHYQTRPISTEKLLIASLHTQEDIHQANKIKVDSSVLSPVNFTPSHPEASALGWTRFAALVQEAQHPVYALGGLSPNDLHAARLHGAQGVAGLRSLWHLHVPLERLLCAQDQKM